MNNDGTVKSHQKISDTEGGFDAELEDGDHFGHTMVEIGDLDGDNVLDLAVDANDDDDGGENRGATYILFMNNDGTVKSHQKISDTEGGFDAILEDEDRLAIGVSALGDLDGDGVQDIAVGTPGDDDGCSIINLNCNNGAVYIFFMNNDGTVKSHQKISETDGGFGVDLDEFGSFGHSVAIINDLNNDGITDLVVGAHNNNDGGPGRGAMYILFMNNDGTVKSHQKISDTEGGFAGQLDDEDEFGHAVVNLNDFDGDGIQDIAIGALYDDDGGIDKGAVWIIFLNNDGTVKSHQKISDTEGGLGQLGDNDWFGKDVAYLGDVDNDGVPDFAVGAHGDDDGCPDYVYCDTGAVYILFMNNDGTVKSEQKISAIQGGFNANLEMGDEFGYATGGRLGDFDGDGTEDLVVGAYLDDDGGTDKGAIYILFLNNDGTVKSHQKISDTQGGLEGELDDFDWFGHTVSFIGDLNGDGIKDLAVGATRDVENGIQSGSLNILFLNNDATVKSFNKISAHTPGIGTELDDGDNFGHTVSPIGDLDGDGVTDLVVGTETNDSDQSVVFILFMNADGTLKDFQKISDDEGGFEGELDDGDHFGVSAHGIGDLDLDGNPDIIVGADSDNDGGLNIGAAYILFLNSDGTVKSHLKISDTEGGFAANLDNFDHFAHRIVSIDDFDNDGFTDLLVSAFDDDDGGTNRGAVYLIFLNDPSSVGSDSTEYCNNMTVDELLVAFPSANIFDNRGGASTIMIGTPDADLMLAGNNGDELRGEGGDDCIIGGDGNDDLKGKVGNDQIYGNDGNDKLRANRGDDILDGGAGADVINAGIGLDVCITDQFDWFIHSCELFSLPGQSVFCDNMTIDELLVAFPAANIFDNRGGASTIMIGTPDADLMLAGNNGDELRGEGGDDCIIGGDGNDDLKGKVGNDQIYGNDGNDKLRANRGDDILDGGAGADVINAGIGLDVCITDQFDWFIHSCEL